MRTRFILGATLVAAAIAVPARARSQTGFPPQYTPYLPPFAFVTCTSVPDPAFPNLVGCDKLTFFFGSHGGLDAHVHQLRVKLTSPGWQFAQPMNFLAVQDYLTFLGGPPPVPHVISSSPSEFFIDFLGRDAVMRAYDGDVPEIYISLQVAMAQFMPPIDNELPSTFEWQFAEWDPNGELIASNITPEPVTLALFATGLGGLGLLRRRRRARRG